jgi:ribosomal protein L29
MDTKKFRVFKLRKQPTDDLVKQTDKLKQELNSLRIAKVAGGVASKLGRIGVICTWSWQSD